MKKISLFSAFVLGLMSLTAQTFIDKTPSSFVQNITNNCSSASGDINGDGKLDIVLTGSDGSGFKTWIYLNDGNGGFTLSGNTGINTGMIWSSIDLGDYDVDGDLDLVMQGWEPLNGVNVQSDYVFQNNGHGVFTKVATITGLSNGNIQFGDYDNDGKMDIIQTGWSASKVTGVTTIYHNDGNNIFTPISTSQIPGIADGQAKWSDLDNDGKLDIVIEGWNATKIYKGNGAGGFTEIPNTLPAFDLSFVNIVDYDKDGKLDMLYGGHVPGTGGTGNPPFAYSTKLAKGDGTGHFTLMNFGLPGAQSGPVQMGDCNKDGFNDFFISGWNGAGVFQIFKNDGTNNAFTSVAGINNLIPGWADGTMQVKDFNGDGYDEIFKCGWNQTGLFVNLKSVLAFQVDIDGYHIQNLDKSKSVYNLYLPYSYNTLPIITTIQPNYSITQAVNITGTETERTGKVVVPSDNGGAPAIYSIVFEKLPKLDLFLCIGQSNMVGYGSLDSSQGDLNPINKGYLFNSSNLFEQANNPLAKSSTVLASFDIPKLGPSYSFGKTISANTPNSIGLIVNPRGASSINSWLREGNGSLADTLYAPTIKRAIEAKKWGEFKAILWHQGEADMADTTNYKIKLIKLVSELRTDLGNNQLLFVAGQIGQWRTDFNLFNSMITRISSFIPNSAYTSTDGLTNGSGDTWHFDRRSQIILGERYADIIKKAIYSNTAIQQTIENPRNQIFISNKQLIINTTVNKNEIQIFDIAGKILKNETFASTNIKIDISKYQDGSYIVKLKNNQGQETKIIQLH